MAKKPAVRKPPPRRSVVGRLLSPVQELIRTSSAGDALRRRFGDEAKTS
jgi:hypothetical protein